MIQGNVCLYRLIRRLGIGAAILALAGLATQAQMTFSPPVNASNNAGNSLAPQVAVDSTGNINLLWNSRKRHTRLNSERG